MSKIHNLPIQHQRGNISLQNIFWVVGTIVGLLSIAQFVLTQLDKKSEGTAETSAIPEEVAATKAADISDDVEKLSKPTLLDSPSVKVDNYIAYDNGVVVDETLGIMWMRCSLGQEWNGSNCEGSAKAYSFDKAQQAIEQLNKVSYVGLYNWQLPDIEALQSLIYCSDGYQGSYVIPLHNGDKKTVAMDCTGNYIPTINNKVFPNTQWAAWRGYWSSSQNMDGVPLTVYFNTGKIKAKNKSHYVRVMRRLN